MKLMSTFATLPLLGLALISLVMVLTGSTVYASTLDDSAEAGNTDTIVLADRGDRQSRRSDQRRRANRGNRDRVQSRRTETTRTEDGYRRDTTWTAQDGRTATRNEDVRYDRENQSRTRDVTRTGPGGNTRERSDTLTRTEDGYTRNTIFTGPGGNSATRDVTGSWDAATGTWTKEVEIDRDAAN